MSVLAWVLVGVTAWIVVGTALALLVGRMVRHRDRQVPDDVRATVAGFVPEPRDGRAERSARSFDGPATTRNGGRTPPV